MSDSNSRLSVLEQLLPRAVTGDDSAVDALLRHCGNRLTVLTRRMLGDFQRVRRWVDTNDVLQGASMRLLAALKSVQPQTPREFFALATLQLRRELIDLARHFYGPEGIGAHHESDAPAGSSSSARSDPVDDRQEPASVERWSELHELIGGLPDEEREVVGVLFYQGLSQPEAADVLKMSLHRAKALARRAVPAPSRLDGRLRGWPCRRVDRSMK